MATNRVTYNEIYYVVLQSLQLQQSFGRRIEYRNTSDKLSHTLQDHPHQKARTREKNIN